jgi:hypothetical protein
VAVSLQAFITSRQNRDTNPFIHDLVTKWRSMISISFGQVKKPNVFANGTFAKKLNGSETDAHC